MELTCDLCDTDEMIEWYETECCGGICSECFEGEVLYADYRGKRAYSSNHPHDVCTECYTGINGDTGNTLCRECRKKARTS